MSKFHFKTIIIQSMRSILTRSGLYFCSNKPNKFLGEAGQPHKKYIGTEHLIPYLNRPTTSTQKKIKNRSMDQWYLCLTIAMLFYMNSQDIVPGTWFTDNMFMDFHDKYPYRLKKEYQRTGKITPNYSKNLQKSQLIA